MNHEAKVIFLRRMTEAVRAETLKVVGAGAPDPWSNRYAEIADKAARWQEQLRLFDRNLGSHANFVQMRAAGGGRAASYGQRQSLASHRANIAGLRSQMAVLGQAIAELIAVLNPPSVAWKRFIQSLDKLKDQGGDDLGLDHLQQREYSEIVGQDPGGTPGPGVPGVTPYPSILTLCLALYAILTQKRRS
jgi:hypothetical protein